MFDTKQPFNECLGTLVDGVKYIQGNNAYTARGVFLGTMKDGELKAVKQKPADPAPNVITPPVAGTNENKPDADDLETMDRPTLLAHAMEVHEVHLKGNKSAANLRLDIIELRKAAA